LDLSHTKQKLLDYLTDELEQIIELQLDWKSPETLRFCEQNLNYLLKIILNNPELKELLLWNIWYRIRQIIINIWSDFLDKKILDILLENGLDLEVIVKLISWELENIKDLINKWSNEKILNFYYTKFNSTLKKFLSDEKNKESILTGSIWTRIYRLRREISKKCSYFLDPDIVELLGSVIRRPTNNKKDIYFNEEEI
jgi:hypothetical protein